MLLTSNGKEFQSSVLDGKKLEPKDLIIGSFISGEISKLTRGAILRFPRYKTPNYKVFWFKFFAIEYRALEFLTIWR